MGNHAHILVLCQDIENMKNFYGELKKRITESYKRLTGMGYHEHLSLWDDIAMVPQVLDLEKAIERAAYIYSNPSSADLVDKIEDYPGYSSWEQFITLPAELKSQHIEEVPWVRMPMIEPVSSLDFSLQEEQRLIEKIESQETEMQQLVIHPFAWVGAFGVSASQEIEEIRRRIISRVREYEEESRERRQKAGSKVIGAKKLSRAPINTDHRPKKKGVAYFCLTSSKELFFEFRERFKRYCAQCEECFRLMCMGVEGIKWPLEAYVPPRRRLANPWVGL
jgi:hypothetical protein